MLRLLLAVLCIGIVLLGGTIQAAHAHPDGLDNHVGCALCSTAHVSTEVAKPPVTLYVAKTLFAVMSALPVAPSRTFFCCALFTRPPPAKTAFA